MATHSIRHRSLRFVPVLVLLSLLLTACGDDDKSPVTPGGGIPSPTTAVTGIYLNGFEAGLMTISIPGANLVRALRGPAVAETVVTVSAGLSPDGGGFINLNGTYDTETDSLELSGQGYHFVAEYVESTTPPLFQGSYDGPNGGGSFGAMVGSPEAVRVFCGEFRSDSTATAGRWNLAIQGTTLIGFESPNGDPGVVGFSGSASGTGTLRSITFSTGGSDFVLYGDGTWNTSTDHVEGTWTAVDDSGTWSVDRCLAGTTGPN